MVKTILPRRIHQILTLDPLKRLAQIPRINDAIIDRGDGSDELVIAEVVIVEGVVAETMV